jgi:uncharacterized membrane-anchored protein YitT (DUF2179 family)
MKIIMNNIKSIKTICQNLLLISAGSILCAVAIKGILVPKQFLAGGITGLALLIHYILPRLPVGVIYFFRDIVQEIFPAARHVQPGV